jgi:nucleoid-associated protein YgaU
MPFLRASIALALLLAFSGCGLVHFGRLPETTAADATLNTAYSDLSTEYKILKQELVLSRKEGAALRAALETRGTGAAPSPEFVSRLNETTRELAALRASYAKLSEAKYPSAAAAVKTGELEEKLAVSLRNYTKLQEENARLRSEVDRTRVENTALAAQVKTVSAQNEEAQYALAQLNTELLAQKEARARAEQQAAANAAQLTAVMARSDARPATLAEAREVASTGVAALAAPVRLANAPATGAAPTAELRTSAARLNPSAASAPRPPLPAPAAVPVEAVRIHLVQPTDTLEKIAQKYYGDPARWRTIYFANNSQLSGGRPLQPGMELEIPKD